MYASALPQDSPTARHSPADLRYADCDERTGIVAFQAPSASAPGRVNTVSLDTITGAIHCDCIGAEHGRRCWHADLVARAWEAHPAMLDVRWLPDARLFAYGKKAAAMATTYRARIGRVLPMDALNVVAARYEWRCRQTARAALPVAA